MKFKIEKPDGLDFELTQVTTPNGRFYLTPEGNKYPSVTTVLERHTAAAIKEWRERVGEEEANRKSGIGKRRGSALHLVCEEYLQGRLDDLKIRSMMPHTKELFLGVKKQLDQFVDVVYAVEQPLYSNMLKLAGRVDCVARWKGKNSVLDFKTSNWQKDKDKIEHYFMQCAGYAHMFEERTKFNLPIEDIVLLITTEEGVVQVLEEKPDKYLTSLENYIKSYEMVVN